MYFYKVQDVLFFFKCLQDPQHSFNIHSYISFFLFFSSSRYGKLSHNLCHTSVYCHFYFNRLFCLWNSLLAKTIELFSLTIPSKVHILTSSWITSHVVLIQITLVHSILSVPALLIIIFPNSYKPYSFSSATPHVGVVC